MTVPLNDDQRVAPNISTRHVPRLSGAADTQSLALADGVVHQACVRADYPSVAGFHRAGFGEKVTHEEFAERPLPDEADSRAVAFGSIGQADLAGERAHIAFEHAAEWKEGTRQLRLVEPVQEIALVLRQVDRLEQQELPILLAYPRIVSGRDALGAQLDRVIQERFEFDFRVA